MKATDVWEQVTGTQCLGSRGLKKKVKKTRGNNSKSIANAWIEGGSNTANTNEE